jgi:hypothetical protein
MLSLDGSPAEPNSGFTLQLLMNAYGRRVFHVR